MDEYIKREAFITNLYKQAISDDLYGMGIAKGLEIAEENAKRMPYIEIVRCKDCVFYHKAHVLCDDGTEKDYSEFPPEAFGISEKYVTGEYGINVGGKCEIDKNNGYAVDKSVFRKPNDFCSFGERMENDGK